MWYEYGIDRTILHGADIQTVKSLKEKELLKERSKQETNYEGVDGKRNTDELNFN